MGKRVSPDERPYRPVQEALVRSVLDPHEATDMAEPTSDNGTPMGHGPLTVTERLSGNFFALLQRDQAASLR